MSLTARLIMRPRKSPVQPEEVMAMAPAYENRRSAIIIALMNVSVARICSGGQGEGTVSGRAADVCHYEFLEKAKDRFIEITADGEDIRG